MDPITAGFTLATAIVELITRVWDATPDARKAESAGDVARTLHNCSAFLQGVQAHLNAAIAPKEPPK